MSLIRSFVAAASIAAIVLSITATAVSAGIPVVSNRYVDDDGLGSATGCEGSDAIYESIQSAVNDSAPGNKVIVCPGTYTQSLFVTNSGVIVRGLTPWTAVLVAPSGLADNSNLIDIRAPNVTIKWLRLLAPTEGDCHKLGSMISVFVDSEDARIRANHIEAQGPLTNGACGYLEGIGVNSAGSKVTWNRVTDFQSTGIGIGSAGSTVVRGNTVSYLHAGYPGGVTANAVGIYANAGNANTLVRGNTVRGLETAGVSTPSLDVGINVINANGIVIRANRVRYVQDGMVFHTVQNADVFGNVFRSGVSRWGLTLLTTQNSKIYNNEIKAADRAIFVTPGSAGSDNDFNDIHDNDFDGVAETDCWDTTEGSGTLTGDTKNTWANNIGVGFTPDLCTPAP